MVTSALMFEDLSPEEQNAVTDLRSRMAGHMDNEMFEDVSVFIRFLRARDLNLNAAEAMLRNHIEWRRVNQVDTILTDYTPKEVCAKYFPMCTIGIDKEKSPIIYIDVGRLDTRGILKSSRKIDAIKLIIQKLEANLILMKNESYKCGNYQDKWMMILNFENVSFANATHKQTLEFVGSLIVMYEANYPERLKVAYFINISSYFALAFSVLKHFISANTYKKIKFFGKDGWSDAILKMVDAEVLPEFLGGKRTDPDGDPLCKSVVIHGSLVPESYYIKKKVNSLLGNPAAEKLIVSRLSKTQLIFNVTDPGSHIEWEFETKNRDIGFSLHYKKDSNEFETTQLIPNQRIDTSTCSETGLYKCEAPGIYIIEFDNTYSWLREKEIYYRASVVKSLFIQ